MAVVRKLAAVAVLIFLVVRVIGIVVDYQDAAKGGGEANSEATSTAGPDGEGESTQTPSQDATATPEETAAAGKVVIVAIPGLNFRMEPKPSGEVLKTLPKGTRLILLSETNGWYQVRADDGTVGWVSASEQYVRVEDATP